MHHLQSRSAGLVNGVKFSALVVSEALSHATQSIKSNSAAALVDLKIPDLDQVHARLQKVVGEAEFKFLLGRALRRDAAQLSFCDIPQLIILTQKIIEKMLGQFKEQEACGRLKPEDLVFEAVFKNKKVTKAEIRNFIQSCTKIPQHQQQILIGKITDLLQKQVGNAIVMRGEHRYFQDQRLQAAVIQILDFDFLDRRTALRLAQVVPVSESNSLVDYLLAIEKLPRVQLVMSQEQLTNQLQHKIQQDLVRLALGNPQDLKNGTLQTVSEIVAKIFSSTDLKLSLSRITNLSLVLDKLLLGVKNQQLVLKSISCPDYSGEIVNIPGNQPTWKYDFKDLGAGAGIVAQKGLPFVQALIKILKPYIAEISFEHFEPSFEVIEGFGELSNAEALQCLRSSNQAIAEAYAAAGITARCRLTAEVISDDKFFELKNNIAEEIRLELLKNPLLEKLVAQILKQRRSLYEAWYKQGEAEKIADYETRIKQEIIPLQMADYVVIGSALASDPNTLIVAYDSPIMGESYALWKIAALYGQGKDSLNYYGA